MKKTFLTLISSLIICAAAFADAPPAAVQKAFEQKFPKAEKVRWGKEGAKEWEAEFSFEGQPVSANFDLNGNWVETEIEIKVADLPKAVAAAIAAKYAGYTVTEADRTETAKHGTIYEADLLKGKDKKEVAFKEDGTPVAE